MLPRAHRLKRMEVERVYRKGRRMQGLHLAVRIFPISTSLGRATVVVPVSVSKKATDRNRAKRILRALLASRNLSGSDVVLSVRRLPAEKGWSTIFKKELDQWLPAK